MTNRKKEWAKHLFAVAGAVFLGIMVMGCTCCKREADANNKKACAAECTCPLLMVMEEDVAPDGSCAVCTIYSAEYCPCSNAVAACPAQACKSLDKAPLCGKCKQKIMECADARKACPMCGKSKTPCAACTEKMKKSPVKKLMCKESMKQNMNCTECAGKAKDAAKKRAAAMQNDPDASDDDGILVIEGEIITVTDDPEAPAPAETPAKKDAKAEAKPAVKPVAPAK